MKTLHGIFNGLRQIWAHKIRSALTILGIVLGVAATVAMIGLIQGMFSGWRQWIVMQGGIEKVAILKQTPPDAQKHLASLSPGRTLRDAEAIRQNCPLATHVSPELDVPDPVIERNGKKYKCTVQGATRDILVINAHELGRGRFLADLDVERFQRTAIIGTAVVKELFRAEEDPIGQQIKIRGLPFTVVGVLAHYEIRSRKRNIADWKNKIALIPVTTALKCFTGNDQLTWLNVRVADAAYLEDLEGQLTRTLLQTHRGIEDFKIDTKEEMLARFASVQQSYMFTLGGIAAISLLVGGIGIMNVMLASLNERIREIGIRKAVGARNYDLFIQFLCEAVTLAVLGGVLGVVTGASVVYALQTAAVLGGSGAPQFSLSAVAIGFAFSVAVGIVAGIYPAVRAARLDPIVALRYE